MRELVQVLTPLFGIALVIQQFLEIIDPFTTANIKNSSTKKIVLALVSIVIGCMVAGFANLRLLQTVRHFLPNGRQVPGALDIFVSGIFISAATEGCNSLLKLAAYKKEASKADAARKRSQLSADELHSVNP